MITLSEPEIKSSGYVVDTLEAAVWCFMTTDSYADCVLKAVNLGDDTDTVASIAGGFAGLYYGYENIPSDFLQCIVKREMIEDICERLSRKYKRFKELIGYIPYMSEPREWEVDGVVYDDEPYSFDVLVKSRTYIGNFNLLFRGRERLVETC